jgi:hypothetical protein
MLRYCILKGRLVEWNFEPDVTIMDVEPNGQEVIDTKIFSRVNNRGNDEEVWISGRDRGVFKIQIFVDRQRVYAKRIRTLGHFWIALRKANIKK